MKTTYMGLVVLAAMALSAHTMAQNVIQTSAPRSGGFFVQFGDVAPSADAKPGLIPAPVTPPVPTAKTLGLTPVAMPVGLDQYRPESVPASVTVPASAAPTTANAIQHGLTAGAAMPGLAPPAVAPASSETPALDTGLNPGPNTGTAPSIGTAPAASPTAVMSPTPRVAARVQATRPTAPWELAKRKGARSISQPELMPPGRVSPAFFRGLRLTEPVEMPMGTDCDECLDAGVPCDDCSVPCPCPCPCIWQHCTSIRASAIYMRPRDADIAYGVPVDGPISSLLDSPIQVGPVGVLDPDYETGFDVGIDWAIGYLTSITANYRYLESTTSDQISTSAPLVIRSLVAHPSSTSAAADFLTASADSYIQMQVLDLGIRHLFVGGDMFAVNYFLGARAGRIEQGFDSLFEDNGTERVSTDFDFDGAGIRIGLEAERYSCHSCLRGYGRAHASFLAGRFEGRYLQQQSFDPTVVDTSWEAGRVVPILDLELGVGWTSKSGCFKVNVGYMFSSWFNMVKTDDFIHAVHTNDFKDLDDVLSFDGLVGQAEIRF